MFNSNYHTDIPLKKHEIINLFRLLKSIQKKDNGLAVKFFISNLVILLKKINNYYLNR